ncbi:MAG TPA: fructosamine kinase family protein [Candidatus Limnocylindrales bacterium]
MGSTMAQEALKHRLRASGFAVEEIAASAGGVIATAGVANLLGGQQVFAKTLPDAAADGIFTVEAEGLTALRELGGARTPQVLAATADLLVLEAMRPRDDGEAFWEALGRMVAGLHTATVNDRFGWHREGWLGRLRQENSWDINGYRFFAERRILRWLREPLVQEAFDREDRRALERLCEALPELVPPSPPVLTHGDLWSGNVLADPAGGGGPVLIDPAVSYTWAEVDVSMMWCGLRPPAAERFFDAYADVAGLEPGWRERMPILFLRELLSQIAHGDGDWGAAAAVRETISPFRSSAPTGR